ncbi:MAG: hypothetical protein ABJB74_00910 [Gemmatimonas sp.]
MRFKLLSAAAVAVVALSASSASAQAGPARRGPAAAPEQRAEMRDRLKAMTPEERKAALDKAKDQREHARANATEAQKAWVVAYNAELKSTHEGVKAGTLTRQTAASQLKAWRESNPRPAHG